MSKLIQYIKENILPDLSEILYVTDSPFHQYRNKFIFSEIVNHDSHHGCKARWLFFEAGHGKGPCDGLGGTVKRLADQSVRSKGTRILDAQSFFQWATQANHKVKYLWYGKEEVMAKKAEMEEVNPLSIPGTGKCHSARPNQGKISIRDTSCAGADCKCDDGEECQGWSNHDIQKVFLPNQYVAAVRGDGNLHLGQIVTYTRPNMNVKFLVQQENQYVWPAAEDMEIIPLNNFLCKVAKPRLARNVLKFTETTLNKAQKAFEKHQQS